MSSLNLPANFSALPIVLKVEQRFGVAGFARLIKLLGLLPSSPDHALGIIELPAAQLPKVANEWCQWLAVELSMPAHHGKDPYNQSLFRHWCATNVTIDEMNAAIELAIKAGAGLTPSNLHTFLKTVRKEKLDVARR